MLGGALDKVENKYGVRREVNEVFLFHGCSNDSSNEILASGFDPRISKSSGLYGKGTYFARQLCKAMQYAVADSDGLRIVIVARVALGTPSFAKRVLIKDDVRRPPMEADSIIAAPGVMPGHHASTQTHCEYVVFDKAQAYPSFILKIKLCKKCKR